MRWNHLLPLAGILSVVAVHSQTSLAPGRMDSSSQIKRLFADPPREYSSAPLWVWNDLMTEDQEGTVPGYTVPGCRDSITRHHPNFTDG